MPAAVIRWSARTARAPGSLAWAVISLSACAPALESQTTTWPEGTVVAVNGIPISAAEVDRYADLLAYVDPSSTRNNLRRVALTRVLFPGVVARAHAPELRAAQLERAREVHELLEPGGDPPPGPLAPQPVRLEGSWLELGPVLGPAAMEAELGTWSPLLEAIGAWCFFRLLERDENALPIEKHLAIELFRFPYLPEVEARDIVEAGLDRAELVVVDPAWREIVPLAWSHRMRGGEE